MTAPPRSNGRPLSTAPDRLGSLEPVPDHERHDLGALWGRFARDGYLYLRGLIDPRRVLAFRRFYLEALAPHGLLRGGPDLPEGVAGDAPNLAEVRRVLFDEIVPGPRYDAFCRDEAIVDFCTWFLGGALHLHRRKLIRHARVGDTYTTPAHYDLVYLRGGTDRLISLWIPLGNVPVTQGGLIYLERSHLWAEAFDRTSDRAMIARSITFDLAALAEEHGARWLAANYEAGDVVVHSPYIVHAALDNVDERGRLRLSTDIRYQRADEAVDPRWQAHWRDDDGL